MRASNIIMAFAITLPVITMAMPAQASATASKKAVAPAETWTPPPFERYSGIINRQPFGTPPPDPVVIAPPSLAAASAAALVNQLTLCALNRTPAGEIDVGIVDASQKPPKNYYLNVGEKSDDLRVISADYDDNTVSVEKNGVELTLKLGKGPTVPGAATPLPAPFMPAAVAAASAAASSDVATTPGLARPPTEESYAERLQRRRVEIMRQRAEEAKKIRTEAEKEVEAQKEKEAAILMDKKLHEQNLEFIRSGQPPLPIQLTPEEDSQLVKEGVLPPAQSQKDN